ncbi:zinc metallopeptidase [Chamaesiphon polymorphus]|uniref:Flagellar biosynthesis protein FlgM n=1 Tax=Chamaesiphon polymorphus CCALA 037 TaxID=2107692 RepID=A0A2T1G5G3_9CYAN|nr:zinc metallopeptidase [Chamaesiphon polymorphus]PSB52406.1 flagellar biosynthesis protein FlgM [Chamaesiphon polymorphus CCALA 037]
MFSLLFLLPGMLLMLWAQFHVKGTYQKYAQVGSNMGMTGAQVAEKILREMGITNVSVEPIPGELTDHYDPSAKAVRLSEVVYDSTSLAAAAVAAHECGHVLQDVQGYKPMNIRAALVPAVGFGSNIGPILIMLGFGLGAMGGISTLFINIGILLFSCVVLFHIVTLPVEFDASNRALRLINDLGILQGEEHRGAKKVLNAAALTYVATALYSVLQLIQLLLSRRN